VEVVAHLVEVGGVMGVVELEVVGGGNHHLDPHRQVFSKLKLF